MTDHVKVLTRREALAKASEMLGKAESGAISEQRAILYLELGRQYMAMAHELRSGAQVGAATS